MNVKCEDCKWRADNPFAKYEDEIIACRYSGIRRIMVDRESFHCDRFEEIKKCKKN